MRYEAIEPMASEHSVKQLCSTAPVSESGSYQGKRRTMKRDVGTWCEKKNLRQSDFP